VLVKIADTVPAIDLRSNWPSSVWGDSRGNVLHNPQAMAQSLANRDVKRVSPSLMTLVGKAESFETHGAM